MSILQGGSLFSLLVFSFKALGIVCMCAAFVWLNKAKLQFPLLFTYMHAHTHKHRKQSKSYFRKHFFFFFLCQTTKKYQM